MSDYKCAHCGERSSYQGHFSLQFGDHQPCPNGNTMRATRDKYGLKRDPENGNLYGWFCREGHICQKVTNE